MSHVTLFEHFNSHISLETFDPLFLQQIFRVPFQSIALKKINYLLNFKLQNFTHICRKVSKHSCSAPFSGRIRYNQSPYGPRCQHLYPRYGTLRLKVKNYACTIYGNNGILGFLTDYFNCLVLFIFLSLIVDEYQYVPQIYLM